MTMIKYIVLYIVVKYCYLVSVYIMIILTWQDNNN